jgi:hypothetical protein
MSAIVVLFLVALVLVLLVRLRSGETVSFNTTADPQRAMMALHCILGARGRWQTVGQREDEARFECHDGPDMLVALALLFCFLLPGIVYIALTRRRESLVVGFAGTTAETSVRVSSSGRRGKAAGRALRRHVGFAAALGVCVNARSKPAASTVQGSAMTPLTAAAGPAHPTWQVHEQPARSGPSLSRSNSDSVAAAT